MSSLRSNFTGSAMICSSPFGPTRFGPRRACTNPSSRRSIQFIAATITCTMMKATRNFRRGQARYCIQGFISPPSRDGNVQCSKLNVQWPEGIEHSTLNIQHSSFSSVDFSEDDINGANQGHEISDEVSLG